MFNFLREKDVLDKDFYDYYIKHRKKYVKTFCRYAYWRKAISSILMEIQMEMTENEGGVYIKDWGYFAHYMAVDKKRVRHKKIRDIAYIRKKRTYRYFPNFYPDDNFREWTMENTILKLKIRNKKYFKRGKRYKLHFELIKTAEEMIKNNKKRI